MRRVLILTFAFVVGYPSGASTREVVCAGEFARFFAIAGNGPDAPGEAPPDTLRLAELSSGHSAASVGPVDTRPPTIQGSGHLEIVDWLVASVAMGAIWGVASGYCQDKAFEPTQLWTTPLAVGLIAFVGAAFGDGPNPYVHRHPPVPVADLGEMKKRYDLFGTLDVLTVDGEWVTGPVRIKETGLEVRAKRGRRLIPIDSVSVVDYPDDRDRWWDNAIGGAIGGALWGLVAANNAGKEGDPRSDAPRDYMAAWGAGIGGVTGLVMDLQHHGRRRVFTSPAIPPVPMSSVILSPALLSAGPGVAITIRF